MRKKSQKAIFAEVITFFQRIYSMDSIELYSLSIVFRYEKTFDIKECADRSHKHQNERGLSLKYAENRLILNRS